VISDGIAGRNKGDFEQEFLAYWLSDSSTSSIYSIVEAVDRVSELHLAELTNDLHQIRRIVGNNKKQIETYVRNVDGSTAIRRFKACLYLPLVSIPMPPFPKTNREVFEFLRKLDPAFESALLEFLRRNDHEGMVLCAAKIGGSFALAGWEHIGINKNVVSKGFRPGKVAPKVLNDRIAMQKIRKCRIQRIDSDRLHGRIGGSNALVKHKKVCIVGLGSLGSHIAFDLARSGVEEMVLLDPDILRAENVTRHLCGMSDVGQEKVVAVAKRIEAHLPQVKITHFTKEIHELLMGDPGPAAVVDLMISATGNTAVERRLNGLGLGASPFPPVLYSWIEPYGIACHAAIIIPGAGGCFECCLNPETLGFSWPVAEFGKEEPNMREAGCQTTFSPYSALEAEQAAAIATRLALAFLGGTISESTRYTWVGNLELIERVKARRNPVYDGKPFFSLHMHTIDKQKACARCN
jgi:molybdopterin/thiamine biosynthesis adenylyltransferase